MAPPRKNVSQITTTAPIASKGKGKAIEASSLRFVKPTYPVFISMTMKTPILLLSRSEGC